MSQSDYLTFRKLAMRWANLGEDYPLGLNERDYVGLKGFATIATVQTTKNNVIDTSQNNVSAPMVKADGVTLTGTGAGQRCILDMEINDRFLQRYAASHPYSCQSIPAAIVGPGATIVGKGSGKGSGRFALRINSFHTLPQGKPLKYAVHRRKTDISPFVCLQCNTTTSCMCMRSKRKNTQPCKQYNVRMRFNNLAYNAGSF